MIRLMQVIVEICYAHLVSIGTRSSAFQKMTITINNFVNSYAYLDEIFIQVQ